MTGRERVGAQVARQLEQIGELRPHVALHARDRRAAGEIFVGEIVDHLLAEARFVVEDVMRDAQPVAHRARVADVAARAARSEEHTSELQSLMRISYAVFCSQIKNNTTTAVKVNQPSTTHTNPIQR